MTEDWSAKDRSTALQKAEREGIDMLVIGGGITGAGVFRDAASRGLNVLLVEKGDFASGTSSWSSKLIHGGLRYIAQGQFGVTRESCKERDLLLKNNPNLVWSLASLFPAYKGSKEPLWKVRLALGVYSALANFRQSSRFKTLSREETLAFSPELNPENLQGAGLYYDGQTDDARLVLETIKNARQLGGEAVNYAEVTGFDHNDKGKINAVKIKDTLGNTTHVLHPTIVINAAGPAIERVRGMDHVIQSPEITPAKGIHLVIPRDRIKSEGFVTYRADDGRHLFYIPWDDVSLLGTTDTFSDEIDRPTVRMKDVEYILSATNKAFPNARLTVNDLCSVYAGVRPLVTKDKDKTSKAVSRDHEIWEDSSGLVSVAGGKLTTFREMGEEIVNRVIPRLPEKTQKQLKPSNTKYLPLRKDDFDPAQLEKTLRETFSLAAKPAKHLVKNYGAAALEIMATAKPDQRRTIGNSFFTYAEIPWVMKKEAATSLPDILERRMRMALFTPDQGLPDLKEIAETTAKAGGWDKSQTEAEIKAYRARIKQSYRIQPN